MQSINIVNPYIDVYKKTINHQAKNKIATLQQAQQFVKNIGHVHNFLGTIFIDTIKFIGNYHLYDLKKTDTLVNQVKNQKMIIEQDTSHKNIKNKRKTQNLIKQNTNKRLSQNLVKQDKINQKQILKLKKDQNKNQKNLVQKMQIQKSEQPDKVQQKSIQFGEFQFTPYLVSPNKHKKEYQKKEEKKYQNKNSSIKYINIKPSSCSSQIIDNNIKGNLPLYKSATQLYVDPINRSNQQLQIQRSFGLRHDQDVKDLQYVETDFITIKDCYTQQKPYKESLENELKRIKIERIQRNLRLQEQMAKQKSQKYTEFKFISSQSANIKQQSSKYQEETDSKQNNNIIQRTLQNFRKNNQNLILFEFHKNVGSDNSKTQNDTSKRRNFEINDERGDTSKNKRIYPKKSRNISKNHQTNFSKDKSINAQKVIQKDKSNTNSKNILKNNIKDNDNSRKKNVSIQNFQFSRQFKDSAINEDDLVEIDISNYTKNNMARTSQLIKFNTKINNKNGQDTQWIPGILNKQFAFTKNIPSEKSQTSQASKNHQKSTNRNTSEQNKQCVVQRITGVRKKKQRQQLIGSSCPDCKAFYDCLKDDVKGIQQMCQCTSRHRSNTVFMPNNHVQGYSQSFNLDNLDD